MILVAGSANLDFVVRADHIPGPGETVLGGGFQTHPGGKGANQAVACARAGAATTSMLVAFGDDAHALPLRASLDAAGVQRHEVLVRDTATGVAFICVAADGENAITVAPGANMGLQPDHLPALDGMRYLLMQLEIPLSTVSAYARAAKAQGVKVVLNAAPAQTLQQELLDHVDVLIVNEGELASLAGPGFTIAQGMARMSVSTVVVTLGSRGCCAWHDGRHYLQTASPITPVDTTGAGDTFCGALVAALAHGMDMDAALLQATVAAALACTRAGAQSSIPDAVDVTRAAAGHRPDAKALHALQKYCGL